MDLRMAEEEKLWVKGGVAVVGCGPSNPQN